MARFDLSDTEWTLIAPLLRENAEQGLKDAGVTNIYVREVSP